MAISDTKIANMALIEIGVNTIEALNAQNRRANIINEVYDQSRDELMEGYEWNFAMRRQTLGQITRTEALGQKFLSNSEYANAYNLPSDPFCLRATEMWNTESPFKVEGRILLTDEGGVDLKYIALITDPSLWSKTFVAALVSLLAYKVILPLKQDAQAKTALYTLHKDILLDAKASDGQEGTAEEIKDTELQDVRFQTGA